MRAPTRDDLPAIAEIVRACDLVDFGDVDIAAEWLQEDWRRPRFDPATDAWVLTAPGGQIVAAAQTWDEEPATIFDSVGWVLPRHRGRGLGTALARAVEARAARDAPGLPSGSAPRVHQVFDAENAGARALFEGLGYAPVREFHHMQIDLEPGLGPGSPPPGIEVRPRAERDDPSIFTVMDEGFREHWGFQPEPYERWQEQWRGSATYDPTLWLVATEGGEVVGAALCDVVDGRGWVGDLAVRDAWRRRGIGEALLRAAFARLADRGIATVMLNVDRDNRTGATRLYERAGMRVRRRWTIVARTLTGSA